MLGFAACAVSGFSMWAGVAGSGFESGFDANGVLLRSLSDFRFLAWGLHDLLIYTYIFASRNGSRSNTNY